MVFCLAGNFVVQLRSCVLLPWTQELQHARLLFHCLLEFAQINVHWVGDAIQPSDPLSSASPLALNLSHHQGLFSSLLQVAKVLELQLQYLSFQWIFRVDLLGLTGLISLLSKGFSRVFSSTAIQRHQFFGTQPSYGPTLTSVHDYWKNHRFDYMEILPLLNLFHLLVKTQLEIYK